MGEHTPTPPGRPAGQSRDVRSELVETARRLFAARGYDAVSLRAIGEAARVTPAMIRYYFGGKLGLYEAAVEAAVEPLFAGLVDAPALEADPERIAARVMSAYAEVVARDPWLPPLIMREVMLPGGRLRAHFVERFAQRIGPAIVSAFESARARGELREDVDPSMAALSLIAMATFPHLAQPVVKRVFGIDPSGGDRGRMVDQLCRIHRCGTAPAGKA